MAKKQQDVKTQRVRFHIRVPSGSPKEEFGLTINHIRHGYILTDGEVYDLPTFMIDYIHSFVISETYSRVNGPDKVVKMQKYYCEPVDHELGPEQTQN